MGDALSRRFGIRIKKIISAIKAAILFNTKPHYTMKIAVDRNKLKKVYLGFGIPALIFLSISVLIIYMNYSLHGYVSSDKWIPISLTLMLTIFCLSPIIVYAQRKKHFQSIIVLENDLIYDYTNAFGKRKQIDINDIDIIKESSHPLGIFHTHSYKLQLLLKNGKSIGISDYLVNENELRELGTILKQSLANKG